MASSSTPCPPDSHTWTPVFYASGRLAYWQCAICQVASRVFVHLPEPLASTSCFCQPIPYPAFPGPQPPKNNRRWITPDGNILSEGEPNSVDYDGDPIPNLPEAHAYQLLDSSGQVLETFEASRKNIRLYADHYRLTRYQVIGSELLRFESYCFSDSTYEIPHADEPQTTVLLTGLEPI